MTTGKELPLLWFLMATFLLGLAQAQTEPGGAGLIEGPNDAPELGMNGTFVPYEFSPRYNEHRIDPTTGLVGGSRTFFTVGTGRGALTYTRDMSDEFGRYDSFTGTLSDRDGVIVVTLPGGETLSFQESGSTYIPLYGSNATLERIPTPHGYDNWHVYDRHAVRYRYRDASWGHTLQSDAPLNVNTARLVEVKWPDGLIWNFYYDHHQLCVDAAEAGDSACQSIDVVRLMSVRSNFGYHIKYEYAGDLADFSYADGTHTRLLRVTGINSKVETCPERLNTCDGLTQDWPSVTFNQGIGPDEVGSVYAIDGEGEFSRYTYNPQRQLSSIRFPSSGFGAQATPDTDDIRYFYTNGRVSRIQQFGVDGERLVTYSESGDERTVTITAPTSIGGAETTVSKISTQQILSHTTALGRETTYSYNSDDLVERITYPEGNYTIYEYDERFNPITVTQHPKPGSSEAPVVTSYTYFNPCDTGTKTRFCNKPHSMTNWQGTTNYKYYWNGELQYVDAPDGGQGRLRTEYFYEQLNAGHFVPSGSIVQTTPLWMLTSVVTADRTTSFTYDQSALTNLDPASVTTTTTDGSVTSVSTYQYDQYGNVTSFDGPIPGAVDTVHVSYDKLRRPVVSIAADPDGAGPLLHRATRVTYNEDGQLDFQEQGTATGPTAFSSFAPLEKVDLRYDEYARVIQQRFSTGGVVHETLDISYDDAGRVDCLRRRMSFLTGVGSGCQTNTGPFGHDRVEKRVYDQDNRVTEIHSAYGTEDQIVEKMGYNPNGTLSWVEDARGNLTTYEYDGFDRRTKTYYPDPANGAISSSTDIDEYIYLPGSPLVDVHKRRDGIELSYSYDAIGRLVARDAPGTDEDISLITYSIENQALTITGGGRTITNTYDQMGRLATTDTTGVGMVGYHYDDANRRTRMDYPGSDGLYIEYAYDAGGQLDQIRENGATSGVGVLADYDYDQLGRRTRLLRGNGVATDYAFELSGNLDRLTISVPGDPTKNLQVDYDYNPARQITRREASSSVYEPVVGLEALDAAYDDLNRLLTVNGASASYDDRGNMTSDGISSYTFDSLNRLTQVITGGTVVDLSYDPLGRLAEEDVSGSAAVGFAYDGASLIAELDAASGVVARRYVHGPGADEALVWYEGSGTSDRRFMVADERGSVVLVTDGLGDSIAQNRYSIYGRVDGQQTGRFGFTGQTRITGTDLWHFKARAYDPKLGRFLQPDPIGYGDGLNMYAYAGGDPVNATDPTGLGACGPDAADVCNDIGTGPTIADDILIVRAERPAESSFDLFAFYAANPIDVTFAFQNGEGGGGGGSSSTDPTCGEGGTAVDGLAGAARAIRPNASDTELTSLTSVLRGALFTADDLQDRNIRRQGNYAAVGRQVFARDPLFGAGERYYRHGVTGLDNGTRTARGYDERNFTENGGIQSATIAAVIVPSRFAPLPVRFQQNWLNGSGSYTTYRDAAVRMGVPLVVSDGSTTCVISP